MYSLGKYKFSKAEKRFPSNRLRINPTAITFRKRHSIVSLSIGVRDSDGAVENERWLSFVPILPPFEIPSRSYWRPGGFSVLLCYWTRIETMTCIRLISPIAFITFSIFIKLFCIIQSFDRKNAYKMCSKMRKKRRNKKMSSTSKSLYLFILYKWLSHISLY